MSSAVPVRSDSATVDAKKLKQWLHDGIEIAVLDVREEGVFAKGHMLLACSVPLSQLEIRVAPLVPRHSTRIVLVDGNDGLAVRAANVLLQHSYVNVYCLTGGVEAWAKAGYEIYTGVNVPGKAFGEFIEHHYATPRMDPLDIKAFIDEGRDVLILDSRPFDEFQVVSIPGGIDCPGAELAYRAHDLIKSPETLVVVNCAGRTRSIIGAQSLINAGIPNKVVALKNGTMGWHLAGLKVANNQVAVAKKPSGKGLEKATKSASRVAQRFGVKYITPAQVSEWERETDGRTNYLFDVRSPDEYQAGHLASAISAPGGQLVQNSDIYVGVRNARILLVDDDGVRATMTASWLLQMGWKDVYVVTGALDVAQLVTGSQPSQILGLSTIDCEMISPEELRRELDSKTAVVVDFASKPRYGEGHIPDAWHAIRANLKENITKIPTAKTIVLTSPDGLVATLAAPEASGMTKGATKVLEGGTNAWQSAGLPLERGMTHITDDMPDVWIRAHDRKENREQAMKDYINWEVDLITQIGRDDDVRFKHVPN